MKGCHCKGRLPYYATWPFISHHSECGIEEPSDTLNGSMGRWQVRIQKGWGVVFFVGDVGQLTLARCGCNEAGPFLFFESASLRRETVNGVGLYHSIAQLRRTANNGRMRLLHRAYSWGGVRESCECQGQAGCESVTTSPAFERHRVINKTTIHTVGMPVASCNSCSCHAQRCRNVAMPTRTPQSAKRRHGPT